MAERNPDGTFKAAQCESEIRWFDRDDLLEEMEYLRDTTIRCTLAKGKKHKIHRQGDKESHIRWNDNDQRVVKK